MTVDLSLVLLGTDEAPLWSATVGGRGAANWRHCCEGHYTPEGAAAHGSELAAAALTQYARSLASPSCGALALAAV